MLFLLPLSIATTLQVGPTRTLKTPCEASKIASDGDRIEVDAGLYAGDVCAWSANNLTITGVGGFAHLDADGQASQGKAIWVITGNFTTVEWIEFSGATVPDQNGAGIRQEGAGLTVRHCFFHNNENGILAGDNAESDILIEFSEFADNGFGDGQSHNLYINHVRSLTFQYNNSHHAYIGHTLKSRALQNFIGYNRLADDTDGRGSYQINLPNGGDSIVLGNLIQQAPTAENGGMLSFAEEGASNPQQILYVINNTFLNDRGSGTFIRNASGTEAVVVNNLFVGGGTALDGAGSLSSCLETNEAGLDADFRPLAGSAAIDAGTDPGKAGDFVLWPAFEYGARARPVVGPLDLGALEWGEAEDTAVDSGTDSGDSAHDSIEAADDSGDSRPEVVGDSACECSSANPSKTIVLPFFWLVWRRGRSLRRA